ncbi:MAG TPA: hypothetical protein PKE26_06760 [Kiritimatiellia bacterium]|nr:hypothetical protein [Kiritimatiellia bacterium]HMO98791.1 hypothetical protein [Kiritimatiellia bacterium]HMP96876.1 hypothetical protein [Kiritimatiellia bacterium]
MTYRLFMTGVFLAAVSIGCDQPDRTVRHYREISFIADDARAPVAPVAAPDPYAPVAPTVTDPAPAAAPAASSARMPDLPPEMQTPPVPLEWDTPAGWANLGPSGMRIATLTVEGQECTILSFPGDVGGDEANIRRWLGQIQQSVPDEQLRAFVGQPKRVPTIGGFEARLFDFAEVMPVGAPLGTLVAIIPVGDQTAFIKLTGAANILAAQKDAFEALSRSVRLRPESL